MKSKIIFVPLDNSDINEIAQKLEKNNVEEIKVFKYLKIIMGTMDIKDIAKIKNQIKLSYLTEPQNILTNSSED